MLCLKVPDVYDDDGDMPILPARKWKPVLFSKPMTFRTPARASAEEKKKTRLPKNGYQTVEN